MITIVECTHKEETLKLLRHLDYGGYVLGTAGAAIKPDRFINLWSSWPIVIINHDSKRVSSRVSLNVAIKEFQTYNKPIYTLPLFLTSNRNIDIYNNSMI